MVFAFVDLTPAVEGDFFFSTDDPQLQESTLVERQFGSAPQIFITAPSDRLFSRPYLQRIGRLTDDLRGVEGVLDARSLTRGPEDLEDIGESPFWTSWNMDGSAAHSSVRIDARPGSFCEWKKARVCVRERRSSVRSPGLSERRDFEPSQ